MKTYLLIFLSLFLVSCAPGYSPYGLYQPPRHQRPVDQYDPAYDPDPYYGCIESEFDGRDLTYRMANVATSHDSDSLISNAFGLIGYMMDYSNPRNRRGCR